MIREYHEVDKHGQRIDVHVFSDSDEIPQNCFLGWDEPFYNPVWDFEQKCWMESNSQDTILQDKKDLRIMQLRNDCEQAILGGFSHNIDGERYWFSYDIEAQINFERLVKMFNQGVIHEKEWTAKDSNGEYVRILITKVLVNELSILIQKHVDKKIAKYRDHYISLIMEAQTIEEVEKIHWETDEEIISEEELQTELERINNIPTVEQLQIENESLRTALLELGDLLLGGLE